MRKFCAICGDLLPAVDAKRAFTKKDQNFIMVMSISLAMQTRIKDERSLAELLTKQRAGICHIHLVEAGQYIVAEMRLAGKRLSFTEELEGSRRTAYVSNIDIPQHLVSALDSMAEGLVPITSRDISQFLNHVLKRYYSTAMWPVTDEEDVSEARPSPISICEPVSVSKILAPPSKARKNKLVCNNVSTRSPTFHLEAFVGETDPAVLRRCYLVEGLMLMELFHFCPQCGHKLSETHLTAVGTAAIVKYVCETCCSRPTVQQWESQERVKECIVAHSKEEMPVNIKEETPRRRMGRMADAVAVV